MKKSSIQQCSVGTFQDLRFYLALSLPRLHWCFLFYCRIQSATSTAFSTIRERSNKKRDFSTSTSIIEAIFRHDFIVWEFLFCVHCFLCSTLNLRRFSRRSFSFLSKICAMSTFSSFFSSLLFRFLFCYEGKRRRKNDEKQRGFFSSDFVLCRGVEKRRPRVCSLISLNIFRSDPNWQIERAINQPVDFFLRRRKKEKSRPREKRGTTISLISIRFDQSSVWTNRSTIRWEKHRRTHSDEEKLRSSLIDVNKGKSLLIEPTETQRSDFLGVKKTPKNSIDRWKNKSFHCLKSWKFTFSNEHDREKKTEAEKWNVLTSRFFSVFV